MIQEIITYIIITSAVIIAGYKIYNKFRRKKVRTESMRIDTSNLRLHKCDDCSAECMMRDTINPIKKHEQDLCRKTEIL